MAAGAAVQPAGADLDLVHHRSPRIAVRRLTTARCLAISSTPQPFSASAPVGTGLDALAAAGAAGGLAPRPLQLGDELRADPPAGHVPHVRPLDLRAGPHAARAEHAPVVVQHVARVGRVHGQAGIGVRVADVGHAVVLGQRLELAVPGGHAHGAGVVALGEEQLEGDLAVRLDLRGGGHDGLALLRRRGAGGNEPGDPRDLDHAQPAGADRAQALHVAERGDVLVVGPRHLEDRLAGRGRQDLAVDADLQLLGHGAVPYLSALRTSQRRQRAVSSAAATAVRPSETSAYDPTRRAAGISAGTWRWPRWSSRAPPSSRRARASGGRPARDPSACGRSPGRPSCRSPSRWTRSRRRRSGRRRRRTARGSSPGCSGRRRSCPPP